MNPVFKKLMTHTFTIIKRERNWEGSFEDTETYEDIKGFAEYGKRLVTDRQGEEVVANALIFLPNTAPIDTEYPYWVITQSAPYNRVRMEIINVYPIDDPRTGKTHHYEVNVR